jgi:hypothetical protein
LDTYLKTEDFSLLQLTEYLTKDIIYCDRLIFLGSFSFKLMLNFLINMNSFKLKAKYREFLKLTKYSNSKSGSSTKQNELKQATQIIVQLLEANNLVPVKYRRLLIMNVLPLVKEGLFNEDQIFSVLRSIQNYENRSEYLDNDFSLKKSDKIDEDDDFDGQKWQELLVELSDKLADTFSLKSIEITAN